MSNLQTQYNNGIPKNGYYIDEDGIEEWFLNGELHREDGPAVISPQPNGNKFWIQNGQFHREDGPAVFENYNESKGYNQVWYLNDIEYTPEEMPMSLFLAYCKWRLKHENDSSKV